MLGLLVAKGASACLIPQVRTKRGGDDKSIKQIKAISCKLEPSSKLASHQLYLKTSSHLTRRQPTAVLMPLPSMLSPLLLLSPRTLCAQLARSVEAPVPAFDTRWLRLWVWQCADLEFACLGVLTGIHDLVHNAHCEASQFAVLESNSGYKSGGYYALDRDDCLFEMNICSDQ
jgi:hypothetical protein